MTGKELYKEIKKKYRGYGTFAEKIGVGRTTIVRYCKYDGHLEGKASRKILRKIENELKINMTGKELYEEIKKKYRGYGTFAAKIGVSRSTIVNYCKSDDVEKTGSLKIIRKIEKDLNIKIIK